MTALLAAALAGCSATGQSSSSGNFKGEQATVAKVITNLSSDASSHDTGKICNQLLLQSLAQRLATEGGTCKKVIGDQLDNIDDFSVTVESVQISGTSASARVKSIDGGHQHLDTLLLQRAADGSWRIASLG